MPKIPNNQSFFDRHFLRRRELFLWGPIRDKNAQFVVQALRYMVEEKSEPIYIYIHSDGGDVDAATAIIDEMQRCQLAGVDVATVCQSKAFSAAAFILALGTPGWRSATINSSIMLHQVSYELSDDYASQQQKCTEFYSKQTERLCNLVAQACGNRTKARINKFIADLEKTIWLNSKDAKKFGVIDSYTTE